MLSIGSTRRSALGTSVAKNTHIDRLADWVGTEIRRSGRAENPNPLRTAAAG
jgi:hypothetical protein